MSSFTGQSPKPSESPEYHSEQRTVYRHRVLGISLRAVTWILSFVVFWNLLVLALGIAIAAAQGRPQWEGSAAGRNGYQYADSYHTVDSEVTAGIVFLWCTPSFVALVISVVNLVRRSSMTIRLAMFSAGAGTVLYIFAFALWRECAYSSSYDSALYPVCQHEPDAKWFSSDWRNPLAVIWVLPWLALVAAIMYLASTVLALVAFRRQRGRQQQQDAQQSIQDNAAVQSQPAGFVEMGQRSVSEMETNPFDDDAMSLTAQTTSLSPSRQLSLAGDSASPLTYRASDDDSLLKRGLENEKGGSAC